MCTRLIVNITQVYIPMYTLETLSLSKVLYVGLSITSNMELAPIRATSIKGLFSWSW